MDTTIKNTLMATPTLLLLPLLAQAAAPSRPNVVFILCDDLGYGDLGYTGAPDIKTPHIDALARSGIAYTQYYASAPTSSPTRCALMTGRYQARFKDMESAFHMGVDHIGLPPGEETVARALQRNDYKTALVGKWHLGALPELRPLMMGFDHFEGFLSGNIDYVEHCEKNRRPDLFDQDKAITNKEYMTDFIADKAIQYINSNKDSSFFLFVSFNAPHWPYQGPGDGPCAADGHDWMEGSRPKLTSMIEYTDKRIGDIVRAIEQSGIDSNTLIIFSSDNGGDKFSRNAPYKGGKGTLWEGGIHVPLAIRWTGHIPAGEQCAYPLISMDITATILAATGSTFKAQCDGLAFYPLGNPGTYTQRPLMWRNGVKDQVAIRLGQYKLFGFKDQFSLYNLEQDPAEKTNIATTHPDKVKELRTLFENWEKEMPYKQTKFNAELRLEAD